MNIFSIIFRFSFGLASIVILAGMECGTVWAQIVPDNTLGGESSSLSSSTLKNPGTLITDSLTPITLIQGGALRDSNLFHSFSDFNVNPQERVYFSNPEGVTRTFARITGRNISNINGILGIDGGSSLVIINPNGITFGPNQKLDLKSNLTATTTESVRFENNYIFSTTEPEGVPVINFNVPFGIQLSQVSPSAEVDTRRGNIIVQRGVGYTGSASGSKSGLGGERYGLTLVSEGNIDTSQALIGDGMYNSTDRNMNRTGSENDIRFEANGDIKTGNVFSSENITMISHGGLVDTTSGRLSTEVGIDISDKTDRGNITLKAKDKITSGRIDAGGVSQFQGETLVSWFKKQRNLDSDPSYSQELDLYRSGNIEMTAPHVEITEGARVSTSNRSGLTRLMGETVMAGGVVPGNIIINAGEQLKISGVDTEGNVGGLFSESVKGTFVLSGAIQVSTGNLVIDNLGVISVRSASEIQMDKAQMALINRANIKIKANSVVMQNGGKITTSTSQDSNSGSIEISARDEILLSGKDSGLFANTEASSSGIGGDIRINPNSLTPGTLTITDGAGINLNSSGSGMGGDLDIHVRSLTLNDNAFLSSETSQADGGSVNTAIIDPMRYYS